jgi:hypothetical protein
MNRLEADKFRSLERRLRRCVDLRRPIEVMQVLQRIKEFAGDHPEYQRIFEDVRRDYAERWGHARTITTEQVQGVCDMLLEGTTWKKYSISSLDELEKKIGSYRKEGQTTKTIPATCFAWDIYLGEVIRRGIGPNCVWAAHSDEQTLEISGPISARVWPVRRVCKRLHNGPEAGLRLYCMLVVKLGTGQIALSENGDPLANDLTEQTS